MRIAQLPFDVLLRRWVATDRALGSASAEARALLAEIERRQTIKDGDTNMDGCTGRAVEMWEATVAAVAERDGISMREAIPQVVRDRPDLHQAYLAAVRTGDKPPAPSIVYSDPIATWNDRVQRARARIADPQAAVASVVRDDPELHQQYLEAYNAQRQRRR